MTADSNKELKKSRNRYRLASAVSGVATAAELTFGARQIMNHRPDLAFLLFFGAAVCGFVTVGCASCVKDMTKTLKAQQNQKQR